MKLHLISVRDRFVQGIIRRMHWADARDMLADGLAKGGVDRIVLHNAPNDCQVELAHQAFTHTKVSVGFATMSSDNVGVNL